MILKDHLLQTQETFISKGVTQKYQEAYRDEKGGPGKNQTQKKVYKRRKQEQVDWKEYRDAA